jgi:hypothetical protein
MSSAFELADLPRGSKLRKAAIDAYAAQENQRQLPAGATIVERPARATSPKTTTPRARRPHYQCARCGALSGSLAAAQAHADTHGGARIDMLLEAP